MKNQFEEINSQFKLGHQASKLTPPYIKGEFEMPFNEGIDLKVTNVISDWGTIRKKMFGGTCHILNGNMMCGVYKDYLKGGISHA